MPVRDSKCGGCHLKISSEVESEIRGRDAKGLSICDQCGRIVYWTT
jgi:predicted CXXCH cytochrome family protein